MKKFLCGALFVLLLMTTPVFAGDVTLEFGWDQQNYDRVTEWRLLSSQTAGGPYNQVATIPKEAGGPAFTAPVIITSPDGQAVTWYFVLQAFDANNNMTSAQSMEVSHTVDFTPVPAPVNVTVRVIVQPSP